MPKAKSKAQQQAAGAALSAKRGETKVSDLQGASKDMYESMSEDELDEMASTDRSDLPDTADDDKKDEVYSDFTDCGNKQPKELEEWLETQKSKSVGDNDGDESTGHRSGRRIVEIKRTNKDDLTDSQYEHMQKVVGYVHRHTAQKPSGDIEESDWRYSLMNWGHDPCK